MEHRRGVRIQNLAASSATSGCGSSRSSLDATGSPFRKPKALVFANSVITRCQLRVGLGHFHVARTKIQVVGRLVRDQQPSPSWPEQGIRTGAATSSWVPERFKHANASRARAEAEEVWFHRFSAPLVFGGAHELPALLRFGRASCSSTLQRLPQRVLGIWPPPASALPFCWPFSTARLGTG